MTTITLTDSERLAVREIVRMQAFMYSDYVGGFDNETPERFEELSRASMTFAELLRLADHGSGVVSAAMMAVLQSRVGVEQEILDDLGDDEDYPGEAAERRERQQAELDAVTALVAHVRAQTAAEVAA